MSFWLVSGFAFVAICLLAFFLARRLLFLTYKRAGESALSQQRYEEAIRWLGKTERLWSLNVGRQNAKSFITDIEQIKAVLEKIEEASAHLGRNLPIGNYRNALEDLRQEFSAPNSPSQNRVAPSPKQYASAYLRLNDARRSFQKQFSEKSGHAHSPM